MRFVLRHLTLYLAFSFCSQKAEEQYKRTCKKFSQSSKVWTLFGEYFLRRGNIDESRKLLPRSLQSLNKRKRGLRHCKTLYIPTHFHFRLEDHFTVRPIGVQTW